jgi:hypothetical protein
MIDGDDASEARTEFRNERSDAAAEIDQHRVASGQLHRIDVAFDFAGPFFARDVADLGLEVIRQTIPIGAFHRGSRLISSLDYRHRRDKEILPVDSAVFRAQESRHCAIPANKFELTTQMRRI